MARKYSDAIRIRETKSAYNIQKEEGGEWIYRKDIQGQHTADYQADNGFFQHQYSL